LQVSFVSLPAFGAGLFSPEDAVNHPAIVAKVIAWHQKGMDFANAMHLAGCLQIK
jgi:hypothetical protein